MGHSGVHWWWNRECYPIGFNVVGRVHPRRYWLTHSSQTAMDAQEPSGRSHSGDVGSSDQSPVPDVARQPFEWHHTPKSAESEKIELAWVAQQSTNWFHTSFCTTAFNAIGYALDIEQPIDGCDPCRRRPNDKPHAPGRVRQPLARRTPYSTGATHSIDRLVPVQYAFDRWSDSIDVRPNSFLGETISG